MQLTDHQLARLLLTDHQHADLIECATDHCTGYMPILYSNIFFICSIRVYGASVSSYTPLVQHHQQNGRKHVCVCVARAKNVGEEMGIVEQKLFWKAGFGSTTFRATLGVHVCILESLVTCCTFRSNSWCFFSPLHYRASEECAPSGFFPITTVQVRGRSPWEWG